MKPMNLNQSDFTRMTADSKPILVDFWAPWCAYCRRIAPAYDALAEQLGEELTFAKINIDQEPELARQEQIETVPTLVLYRGGQALGSVTAPESKADIAAFVEETLQCRRT